MTSQQNTIVFATPGIIEPSSWELMGCNVKPDKDSPIGFFGTGLKMALAVLLRENATVSIMTPNLYYEFGTKTKDFRGKSFDVITCNDKELGFTTELGKQWTLEHAYRELVSNTMDESGEFGRLDGTDHETRLFVTHAEFAECYDNHESLFVGSRLPIASNDLLNIYKGDGKIFYRGVRVGFIENAMYSYEVLSPVKLTEDRTIYNIYDVYRQIERGIEKLTDKNILKKLVTARKDTWENERSYYGVWGVAMKEVVADIWENSPTKLLPAIQRQIKTELPEVEFAAIVPTEKHVRMLDKALQFMKDGGYEVTAPIRHISNSDNLNIAFVHREIIHLTERAFDQGMFYLVTTLFEERAHTLGYSDETRRFEQWLMNELIKNLADKLEVDL
jgi:hypothetical protein